MVGWGEWGDVGHRAQTFSYKMNTFWGYNISLVTIDNNTVLYPWKLLKE